jgi:4'-phosphopantetheinyl transferase EntD
MAGSISSAASTRKAMNGSRRELGIDVEKETDESDE